MSRGPALQVTPAASHHLVHDGERGSPDGAEGGGGEEGGGVLGEGDEENDEELEQGGRGRSVGGGAQLLRDLLLAELEARGEASEHLVLRLSGEESSVLCVQDTHRSLPHDVEERNGGSRDGINVHELRDGRVEKRGRGVVAVREERRIATREKRLNGWGGGEHLLNGLRELEKR